MIIMLLKDRDKFDIVRRNFVEMFIDEVKEISFSLFNKH